MYLQNIYLGSQRFKLKGVMKIKVIAFVKNLFALTSCQHDPFTFEQQDGSVPNEPVDTCDANLIDFNEVKPVFAGCAISGSYDAIGTADYSLVTYQDIVNNHLKDGDISNSGRI